MHLVRIPVEQLYFYIANLIARQDFFPTAINTPNRMQPISYLWPIIMWAAQASESVIIFYWMNLPSCHSFRIHYTANRKAETSEDHIECIRHIEILPPHLLCPENNQSENHFQCFDVALDCLYHDTPNLFTFFFFGDDRLALICSRRAPNPNA